MVVIEPRIFMFIRLLTMEINKKSVMLTKQLTQVVVGEK